MSERVPDIFEDFISPIIAAQTLLISCCKKRKEMLERTMQLCMQVLTSQIGEYGPRQWDGALHMVGTLSDILVKKKFYKEEIDSLLSQYVFPEFNNPLGYMRARACWVLHNFATVRFKSEPLLVEAVRLTVNALLNDTDLPVKVEAAIALQTLLVSQEIVHKLLEPQVKAVTTELLKVIRETEDDNIASVLQKIVPLYTEQLLPMAYEIMEHLATTFRKVIETDSGTDEKAITAMGLLNTMQTVLNVMEDNPEIMAQLEKTVLTVVGHILSNNIIEYYEEAMTLLCDLTAKTISADMWKVLELLYQVFEKDSFDYFTDMMPVLHNYITVDTDAFVSNENHILAMFNMAKAVLNSDQEDESEIYAAKLLEVMVLQCNGKIDNCLPSFVELVLNRLTRTVKTSELRTMLLQVLIAILYCNPALLFTILDKLQQSVPNASITQHFIKQWIHDTDCFIGLHDRKLCVLGICTLLEMGPARPALDAVLPEIMPACLVLFDGLRRAYEARAEAEEDTDSEDEDDDHDEEVLSSDEDDIDDMNNEYLENLSRMAVKNSAQHGVDLIAKIEDYESDDDDEDYEPDETAIECYTTPLDDRDCAVDEYVQFKAALSGVSSREPGLYQALTGALDAEQQKQLSAVLVLADQRKAQQDSKRIEQSGDIFEDFISPIIAAQTLLISCCKKRKEMLERTMQLCMQVLTSQIGEYGPRQWDGALHMVGTLSDILVKKKFYKEEIDSLLSQYVFPEFNNPLGYMRARACWVLHNFATVRFKSEPLLVEAVRLTVNALLNDTDLPVKVEAAIALQTLLVSQEIVHKLLEPQVKAVTTELLKVIRETEDDNIASVLQKIVPLYTEQLLPMAYEIMEHLATTFRKVIETDSGTDEKAITAMGLLNTMQTVLNVMEDNPEIMAQLEKTVLTVVGHILSNNIIEYYEEAMTLLCDLTAKTISADMWKVLELLYQVFEKDSFDYFTDMMPVLHNYITVDTDAFVSNENHILAMFNMAKAVLNSDQEDESEIYAAKLLEVMVLQCNGKIDNCLPSFVELVLNRLTRTVKTSELRTMLLQVLIAILYCNPALLFTILDKLQQSVPNASITQHFIKQWIHDTDCFIGLHDRKLCVLGICTLLEMGPARPALDAVLPEIMPACLVLFDGLRRAYEARAEAEEDTDSEDEDDDHDEEVLSSDEDDIDDMNNEYLENLSRMAVKNSAQHGVDLIAKIEDYESDDDDEDYEPDETAIECYTTPLDDRDCAVDEYVQFKAALSGVSSREPGLYQALTGALDAEQQKQLSAVLVLADQRKAQQDSKRIEQSGGYSFTVPAQVPTKFKFGS